MSVADTKFELCHDVERVLKIGRDFQKQDRWRGAHHDTAKLLCDTIEYLRDRLNTPVGNMAAMRETLVALQARFEKNTMAYQDRYFKFTGWHWRKKAEEAKKWRDIFSELNDQCKAALAIPPRNCDVGTCDEQDDRWESFCASHHSPWKITGGTGTMICDCPCYKGNNKCNRFVWAQMSYDVGGAK